MFVNLQNKFTDSFIGYKERLSYMQYVYTHSNHILHTQPMISLMTILCLDKSNKLYYYNQDTAIRNVSV